MIASMFRYSTVEVENGRKKTEKKYSCPRLTPGAALGAVGSGINAIT
jgi:hypothetical protein